MSGRQTAKMVNEWFKTDEHMSQMYGHNDIQNLPWGGDSPAQMETFLQLWDHIEDNLEEKLSEKARRDCFYAKVKLSQVLQQDLAHYGRAKSITDDPDFSYAFLRNSMDRYLTNVHNDRNLAARKAGISDAVVDAIRDNQPLPPMPADESAIVNYGLELFRTHKVAQETFQAALDQFEERRARVMHPSDITQEDLAQTLLIVPFGGATSEAVGLGADFVKQFIR